jgi:biopolymer transport protein ExbD
MKRLSPAIENEEPEVNLTAMLDVVFIMLIFFIVVASFVRETGIPLVLPPNETDAPTEIETLVVNVEPGSVFRVENRVLSKASLIPYLAALYAQNPEANFAVVVARGSVVGDMVAASDAGRVLGFDVIPISKEE